MLKILKIYAYHGWTSDTSKSNSVVFHFKLIHSIRVRYFECKLILAGTNVFEITTPEWINAHKFYLYVIGIMWDPFPIFPTFQFNKVHLWKNINYLSIVAKREKNFTAMSIIVYDDGGDDSPSLWWLTDFTLIMPLSFKAHKAIFVATSWLPEISCFFPS